MKSEPRKQDTKEQLTVASWVKEAGLGIILEEDFPPYIVDIYIPDLHLGIELDGPFHMKKKDRNRDEYLRVEYNLPIWRFTNKEINNGFKSIFIDDILKFAQGQICQD